MKILVIGNGFDLEHGLPTKYKDFLDFMQGIKLLSSKDRIIEKQSFIEELETTTKHKVDQNIKEYLTQEKFLDPSFMKEWKEEEISKELIDGANNNIWIKYFIENMNYEKEGWIDLESEISNVIQSLDYLNYICKCYKYKPFPKDMDQDKLEIARIIIEYIDNKISLYEFRDDKLKVVINTLVINLNKFIHYLEIYLGYCVEKMQVKYISPDLETFEPHNIVSFNYTKTHKEYYTCEKAKLRNLGGNVSIEEEQYEYIHGKVDITRNASKNNMVLGIDEYLDNELKNKELDFIAFKKYFQRIYKKTGNAYKDWIKEMANKNQSYVNSIKGTGPIGKNEIYIFGHSLDITDKDIIKELIECPNTVTTIFYYNKEAYAQQIANMVKIIGQDELIKRVSGADPTIIFKKQKERIERN